ncbi:MAG: prolyl oligopeptidase family serine peptidase, partial [Parcubacteria group bacterium]
MRPFRTRFAKDIVAEFLPPTRRSHKVIILCQGMPTVPNKRDELEFFSKKGYWAFHLRYRGTWESRGEFLRKSPHLDVLDVIKGVKNGFKDTISGKRYRVNPRSVYLIGTSFGGPAALLASIHPSVTKVVALAPVVDWNAQKKSEPANWLYRLTKESFGEGYRWPRQNVKKLYNGKFYNPVALSSTLIGKKIMIMHEKNDPIVPYQPGRRFAKEIGCTYVLLPGKEHSLMTVQFI